MLTSNEQQGLTGSLDLLTLFKLNPLYDEYVRPSLSGNEAESLEPTFASYIGHLPGKFDMTPDNSLMQLIRNPQQIDIGRGIEPFSDETLRESFSLQQGRIPEFDTSLLGLDDGETNLHGAVNRMPSIKMTFGTRIGGSGATGLHDAGDQGLDKKHKKKKKKRKHGHENEDEGGHVHSDHKKKKKRKKERELGGHETEVDAVVIDD
ncbi:hypothetical protein K450DRAFT_222237 [Umbelopsis ramanniana AG]|uniref:Mediator of RNA polymerase II transcription subunit 19 n=1 Tax=Umbelopsis ramanniana AG TaxID=1314678 RepID=A0AAD5EHS7_UMBRA|nr:uncharacterized protein K450DRAFT_222237 [Umbelopsis ramanniana AG]KAI8583672.1 hypothetical protein K450DRAFT_222237 [Umbelopsis ramanniana AG]